MGSVPAGLGEAFAGSLFEFDGVYIVNIRPVS